MTLLPLDVARAVPTTVVLENEVGTCDEGGGRHGSQERVDVLPRPRVPLLPCVRHDGNIDDNVDTPLAAEP